MRKRFQLFLRPPSGAQTPPGASQGGGVPRLRKPAVLLGCCAVLAVIALMAWLDRVSVLREARQNALALTYSLAEQADSVFIATELALFQLEQAVGAREVSTLRTDGDLRRLVGELMRRLPHLDSLMLVDAAGHVAASSAGFPTAADDVGDSEFFLRAREGHDGLHFSVPPGHGAQGSASFTASRPLRGAAGFAGALAVTLHPDYFPSLYRGTLISNSTVAAALVRRDGTVIVSSADMPLDTAFPGAVLPATAARDSGFVSLAMADGRPGIAAFRTLPVARLTLVYLMSEGDVLAAWHLRLTGYSLAAVLAGGAMVVVASAGGEVFRPRGRSGARDRPDAEGRTAMAETVPSRIVRGVDSFLTAALNALALGRSRLAERPSEAATAEALEGAAYGLSAAQRLIGSGRVRGAPQRIVDVRPVLSGLRSLMLGSVWPPLELTFGPGGANGGPLEVFADPARLDLVFLDLVLGLREIAPAGTQIAMSAQRRVVRDLGPERLLAGDYVCVDVRLAAASGAVREGTIRSETRLRHVEIFASQCQGELEIKMPAEETPGGPLCAVLWLPAALARRPLS